MNSDNDLYTDYALQLFSSYVSDDLDSMHSILESFKKDGKALDSIFMPGVIYGLMYHFGTWLKIVSDRTDIPMEKLLSDYALDYAIVRESLLSNPLLNVSKARENLEQLIEQLNNIEDLFDD